MGEGGSCLQSGMDCCCLAEERTSRTPASVTGTNLGFQFIIPHAYSAHAETGMPRGAGGGRGGCPSGDRGSGSLGVSYRWAVDCGVVARGWNAANRIGRRLSVVYLFLSEFPEHVAAAIELAAAYRRIAPEWLAVFGAGRNAAVGREWRHLRDLPGYRRQPDRSSPAGCPARVSNQPATPPLFRSLWEVARAGTGDGGYGKLGERFSSRSAQSEGAGEGNFHSGELRGFQEIVRHNGDIGESSNCPAEELITGFGFYRMESLMLRSSLGPISSWYAGQEKCSMRVRRVESKIPAALPRAAEGPMLDRQDEAVIIDRAHKRFRRSIRAG
jgi:hypothetical protein